MIKKSLIIAAGLLLVVALMGLFPAGGQAQQAISENFLFVNFIGQEMVLDLDDVTYLIPGTDTIPDGGRLALQLEPGEHKFAANLPAVGRGFAGEFTLEPGGFVAKGAELRDTPPVVDNDGILLEKPDEEVFVFDFDPFSAPVPEAPLADAWQPAPAAPGQGSLVWINHSGADELTVDLSGQIYKVPPKSNDIPGRLQVEVAPGFYRYTASVPNGSFNGEITVVAGQVSGLNIVPGIREEPEFDIGDEFDPLPAVDLKLFQEDLSSRTAAAAGPTDSAPAVLPATGGELGPAPAAAARAEGLLIKNFAGQPLTFTINNQVYTIDANAEQTLTLPPGLYTYTASVPSLASGGMVNLQTGQSFELSVVVNVNGDVLNVYQN